MFEIDRYSFANICQRSVDSIEKCVFRNIILRSDPFALQNSPKGFGNVQLGRIWWKIEKEQSTLLPKTAQLFYFSVSVNRCIIKNHECVFLNFEREPIQKSMTLSASMLSVVQNPSYRLFRSIIPKMLSLSAFKEGI